MMFLVDVVTVAPGRLDEYLELVRTRVVPVMTEAGADYEYCRATSSDIGQPVEVECAWSFADNAAWNEIRCKLVLDPRYYEYAALLSSLRLGGRRRFQKPVDLPGESPT